jgi:hypothetical protein
VWRLLLVLTTACVVVKPADQRPRWRTTGAAELDAGCALARAFVRKTGKDGFGVALQLRSRGDCTVVIDRADLVFAGGERVSTRPGVPRQVLTGRSQIYVWLPVAFDNNAAWNAERNTAVLELAVSANAAPVTWRIPVEQAL